MASALSPDRSRAPVRPMLRAWAEINLDAVADNVRALLGLLREGARILSAVAVREGRPVRTHLKIDTGMGRLGVTPAGTVTLAREMASLTGLILEGCCTHLATADELDLQPAQAQLETFSAVLRRLQDAGIRPGIRHAANSAALLALPQAHLDMVRPGIALYGVPPAPHLAGRATLRRAM